VSIGGKRLKLPSNLLRFDSKGNGGTIIDSGTSFTIFPEAIYNQIVGEFASQIAYRRAREILKLRLALDCVTMSLVWRIFSCLSLHSISRVAQTWYCLMRIVSCKLVPI
jgi:hypothetical protein